MQTIAHLTLFTGHLHHSPRSEVHRETIDLLMPYVKRGGGKIGSTGWTVRMVQGVASGSCGFELHYSGFWLFSCYMTWTTTADAPMWDVVRELSKTTLDKPKSVPWLAVHAMPQLAAAPMQAIMAAGDLERCVAWTIIEAMAGASPLAA
jgi:hypothetical protein